MDPDLGTRTNPQPNTTQQRSSQKKTNRLFTNLYDVTLKESRDIEQYTIDT